MEHIELPLVDYKELMLEVVSENKELLEQYGPHSGSDEYSKNISSILNDAILCSDFYYERVNLGCEGELKVELNLREHSNKESVVYTPLNAFFLSYFINAGEENIESAMDCFSDPSEADEESDGSSDHHVVKAQERFYFTVVLTQGMFWFFVDSTDPETKVDLVMCKYKGEEKERWTIRSRRKITGDDEEKILIVFMRVDPFKCTYCEKYGTNIRGINKSKKCKGCWDNLGMDVRYCSKDCQRKDWTGEGKDEALAHKRWCGSSYLTAGTVRDLKIELSSLSQLQSVDVKAQSRIARMFGL